MYQCDNWKDFLSSCDLINDRVQYKGGFYRKNEIFHTLSKAYRREWDEGFFIGNGMIGAMIYPTSPQTLGWELGRCDVMAHNWLKGIDWAIPRVPIGNVLLTPVGKIRHASMRLHLYDAEVIGEIETTVGSIWWRSLCFRQSDTLLIELRTDGGENECRIGVQPQHGVSGRIYFSNQIPEPSTLPPTPVHMKLEGLDVSVQTFLNDQLEEEGECALCWKEVVLAENHRLFYLHIAHSDIDHTARISAVKEIQKISSSPIEEAVLNHQNWWHQYYPQSFLSLNDAKWQKFYWVQMYKVACATRPNGVILDTQGPWLTITPWPITVWNLNVQLSYSPLLTSNRLDLFDSLIHILRKNRQNLIDNAKPMGIDDGMYLGRSTTAVNLDSKWPGTHEMGNLTWVLYLLWRKYQITGDKELAKNLLFPYLKLHLNAYMVLLRTDSDGIIHLNDTSSPEYPVKPGKNWMPIEDCSYTLALFRWALSAAISLNRELKVGDAFAEEWQRILDHLTDYPCDENGYSIGNEVPMTVSHRHYSHLFMIYPLHLVDLDDVKQRELVERSIRHWTGLMEFLQGYTFTGASAMMALLKKGNKALEYLNALDDFLTPNTMYSESGPVIETPLSATESIHLMLVQSHQNCIEIFPSVPDSWTDICFQNFLLEGGYEVSAIRKNGTLKEVTIHSLRGIPFQLKLNTSEEICFACSVSACVKKNDTGWDITLPVGETIFITTK